MKREILFRGKLIHSNEWIEGNLIIVRSGRPYIIPFEVFEPDGHHLIIDSDSAFWVIPESVGQFTGLTDKNGKKIFEGDVLSYPSGYRDLNGEQDSHGDFPFVETIEKKCVEWEFNQFTNLGHYRCDGKYTAEVIGNIHDNPELLK